MVISMKAFSYLQDTEAREKSAEAKLDRERGFEELFGRIACSLEGRLVNKEGGNDGRNI